MKETQAHRRREIVSDVEYTFALALNHGDNYLGQAEIKFYIEQLPTNDGDLFLNSHALAVAELKVNDVHITEQSGFSSQIIPLLPSMVKKGWNKVTLKYFTPYN